MPLDYRFADRQLSRVATTRCSQQSEPKHGHLHAWGTTAQGVYRAGDTMEWKVYVRDQSNESLVAAPAGPVYCSRSSIPTGQVVHTVADATLSKFGALSGTYAIPQSAAVGWYQFRLTAQVRRGRAPGASRDSRAFRCACSSATSRRRRSACAPRSTAICSRPGTKWPSRRARRCSRAGRTSTPKRGSRHSSTREAVPLRASRRRGVPVRHGRSQPAAHRPRRSSTTRVDAQGEARHTFRLAEDLGAQVVHAHVERRRRRARRSRPATSPARASAEFVAVDRLVGLRSTAVGVQGGRARDRALPRRRRPRRAGAGHERRRSHRAARDQGRARARRGHGVSHRVHRRMVAAGECAGTSTSAPLDCTFTPQDAWPLPAHGDDSRHARSAAHDGASAPGS